MPLYTQVPADFGAAREMLEAMSKINANILKKTQGTRRRPQPPRSLVGQSASLGAVITWNAPVKTQGIIGFRVYKDNETNLLEEIRDPKRRQVRVVLPGNTTAAFYISTFTGQNAESPKAQIIVSSNTDQLVVGGTGGGTGGTLPPPPPGWPDEPSGGRGMIRPELL